MINQYSMSAFDDELEKIAIIGPLVDVANLGIPSAIGYVAGKDKGRRMAELGVPMLLNGVFS